MALGESVVKICRNPCDSFDVILLTDRQTNKQINKRTRDPDHYPNHYQNLMGSSLEQDAPVYQFST